MTKTHGIVVLGLIIIASFIAYNEGVGAGVDRGYNQGVDASLASFTSRCLTDRGYPVTKRLEVGFPAPAWFEDLERKCVQQAINYLVIDNYSTQEDWSYYSSLLDEDTKAAKPKKEGKSSSSNGSPYLKRLDSKL